MVVDASVVVEALVSATASGDEARAVLRREPQLMAPHLLDIETASAIRRLLAGGVVGEALASRAISQLQRLPIERAPHHPFLGRMWELRSSVSVYDAAYVALAEAAGMSLVTADSRLATAPGIACEVVVLS
jgi:predicted nucleic acid-binding protein